MSINMFSPAGAMLNALDSGQISATELLELHLEQIEEHNPAINVIVFCNDQAARQQAASADAARQAGSAGNLAGLPVTVKDATDVAGLPSTNGLAANVDNLAEHDAPVVASVRNAGAVILGKTNVPAGSGDWQASNRLFGQTNNPWNLERTSGGSTGGAAAVASGMSPLELGSDIGGSVRIPASFCGIYGHKPSETAIPGSNLPNPTVSMAVPGPLARSAADLDLVLSILAGPLVGEDVAWHITLPEARHRRLADFRVAFLPRFDWLPCDRATVEAQQQLADNLSRAGATVAETSPEPLGDFREYYRIYLGILNAIVTRSLSDEARQRAVTALQEKGDSISIDKAHGMTASVGDYIRWHEQRERYRQIFRAFFSEWDILVAPVTLRPAYPHTTERWLDRTVEVDGVEYPYDLISAYPSLATLCGQPATNFPVGFNDEGLPLGLQAIGPYLEDRTTIQFVHLVEQEYGGFVPPAYLTNTGHPSG